MFKPIAFLLGAVARSVPRCLIFTGVYVTLYAAITFVLAANALRDGTASTPHLLGALSIDGILGFAMAGLGHLCRRLLIKTRTREVAKTFD